MGWILPGILFLMVFRLFISYLQYKGFRIELHYFRVVEDKDDSEEKELGVADKFNIVVQVATKVQNTLGLLADQMEKLKNLLTWQEPEQTQRLFGVLIALFIASCLLPGRIFFFIAGLQVGFKLFIQDPIFNRFPRVKEKYDTVYKMWKILPTDDQLQKRDSRAKMLKFVLEPSPSSSSISVTSGSQPKPAVDFDLPATGAERAFQELFSLPVSEVPLTDWKSGRKCVLIDKEKSITSSLAHGKMYLTKSFLCFENSRNPEEHINIPLSEITRLIKAKPFSWMPGSGMSLEITVKDKDKPYIFGGILHRDAVYKSIIKTAKDAHLDWALDVSANKTSSVLSLSSLRAAEDQ
ncbi:GRAM domain-containing protein 4-like [Lingula anatina]|uniref:GRAM domain-containing protein 4-like n=1 Tax=Lingula anatina TaxID=7574 RepID=A0A1S3J2D9_LINAN|nr:GRAM domain-containing protein 4-like [Lingula anatina]|eukprot:XP_013404413.1 GRAM domain-containing protein 4-like [Lingula anatina]